MPVRFTGIAFLPRNQTQDAAGSVQSPSHHQRKRHHHNYAFISLAMDFCKQWWENLVAIWINQRLERGIPSPCPCPSELLVLRYWDTDARHSGCGLDGPRASSKSIDRQTTPPRGSERRS